MLTEGVQVRSSAPIPNQAQETDGKAEGFFSPLTCIMRDTALRLLEDGVSGVSLGAVDVSFQLPSQHQAQTHVLLMSP